MHFGIGRARKVPRIHEDMGGGEEILEQEYHDPTREKKSPPMTTCVQISMVTVTLVILFLGVMVTLVGVWAHHTQRIYLSITMHPIELTRFPLATLVTGIFVSGLALIGLIGGIFFRTITGQTLLGTFTFVMMLLIISELAAGASVIRVKFDLLDIYKESAISSQMLYEANNMTSDYDSTANEWDHFQETYECCGAEGFKNDTPPYYEVFGNDSVPESCCANIDRVTQEDCEMYAKDALKFRHFINDQGCPDVIFSDVEEYMMVIAVCIIIAGLSQCCAVAFASVLLYISSKLKSRRNKAYNYSKLMLKQTRPAETL